MVADPESCCILCGRKGIVHARKMCHACYQFQKYGRGNKTDPENRIKYSILAKKFRETHPDYNDKYLELSRKVRANLPLDRLEKAKKEAEEIAAKQDWSFTGLTHRVIKDRIYLVAIPTGEEVQYHPSGTKKKIGIHRLILEHKLGRKLVKGEEAHHKDDDSLNNDPDNIELKLGPDHNGETHTKIQRRL
jgi:hypothetical protein